MLKKLNFETRFVKNDLKRVLLDKFSNAIFSKAERLAEKFYTTIHVSLNRT